MASSSSSKKGDQELIELQRALLTGPTTDVPFGEGNPEVVQTFRERRAAQREAYGQFVATENIVDPDGNSLVFAAGMPVPVEHVEKWDLENVGVVKRVASPEDARRYQLPPAVGPAGMIPGGEPRPAATTPAKQ